MANKICAYCAAEYDDMLPQCPYCGSTNYKGAEAEYLNQLETVRENMENLDQIHEKEVRKAIHKQGRFLIIVFVILGVIGALVVGLVLWQQEGYTRRRRADFLWKEQNFPIMNELYEKGAYAEVTELYVESRDADYPVYAWEHSDFCEIYENIVYIEATLQKEAEGYVLDEVDCAGLLFDEWQVIGIPMNDLDEQELALLEEYGEKVRVDFETRWNMSEEDYRDFYQELEENRGWVSYTGCKEYVEKWYVEK